MKSMQNNMKQKLAQLLENSLIRFLLGGGTTVLCEYIVFYVLYVGLSWNLLISNSLSFAVGLGISFLFNRLWAFKQDTYSQKTHHQLVMYAVLAGSNLLLNNVIVSGLKTLGLDPRIGKLAAIVIIAVWNFVIYRKIIFKGSAQIPNPVE